jgi:hypothetical protein
VIRRALRRFGDPNVREEMVELEFTTGEGQRRSALNLFSGRSRNTYVLKPRDCPVMVAELFQGESRRLVYLFSVLSSERPSDSS